MRHHPRPLLTGWSLVRIRPGEPNNFKDLELKQQTRKQTKNPIWQHRWQQFTNSRAPRLMTAKPPEGQRFSHVYIDRGEPVEDSERVRVRMRSLIMSIGDVRTST